MEDLHFKCYVLKPYLYTNYSHCYNTKPKVWPSMAEKERGPLLGVSFLSMNYIVFMTADGNMGPVLLSVLHSALLVFH